MKIRHLFLLMISIVVSFTFASSVMASEEDEMAAMQRKLNAEVMEKPFSVADEKKIDAYIKDAMKKDLKPAVSKAPKFWKPGYTCASIYSYGWSYYRNCRYYRHYYGRYW